MLLSILIPTHNRSAVLLQTLERLARVTLPPGHEVEAIVIANACSDGSAAAVAARAADFPFPLRATEEPQPGVAHARNRALKEARGEMVFFLDDDIAVEPEWMLRHLEVHAQLKVDLVVGKTGLWYVEKQPPDWMRPALESILSFKNLGEDVRAIANPGDCISQNLSMTRKVFETVGAFNTALGRRPGSLLGGEEIDFVERAMQAGFMAGYAPRAVGLHWIPAKFLEDEYLRRLSIDIGRTRVFMKKDLKSGAIARRLLANPFRIASHRLNELLALLAGNREGWMKHRIKRWKQQGGWLGTWQYLRGTAPTLNSGAVKMPPNPG
ncbi:MAG: glycosyltransferase family 2 protein [Planctomycetes bacterium]|nr:glycosyltransferase family 2 protein [Planctomycetota bacterium]